MDSNRKYNPAYDEAFSRYLRYGTPITEPYYLDDKIPSIYVWRTLGDEKVRISHQENNGKIFTRNNPPHTGHPGEDYNCRCRAEAYIPGVTEYVNQVIIGEIKDSNFKWYDIVLVWHFVFGEGIARTLSDMGHLKGVIYYYFYSLGIINKVNMQIISEARKLLHSGRPSGQLKCTFRNSYSFKEYLFSFGGSIVGGEFNGFFTTNAQIMYITGNIHYYYEDIFTDPLHLRDKITTGTSDPSATNQLWRCISDGGGTPYFITGAWATTFEAVIQVNSGYSMYK